MQLQRTELGQWEQTTGDSYQNNEWTVRTLRVEGMEGKRLGPKRTKAVRRKRVGSVRGIQRLPNGSQGILCLGSIMSTLTWDSQTVT